MSRKHRARYTAMCIPGHREDGGDDWWCVYDVRQRRTKLVIGEGVLHDAAASKAAELNRRAQRRRRRRPCETRRQRS